MVTKEKLEIIEEVIAEEMSVFRQEMEVDGVAEVDAIVEMAEVLEEKPI